MINMENRNTETIKMMYLEDRPYEKCEQYGAEHLTDVELLAVLLRTGTKGENSLRLAQKILHPPFGSEGLLSIPQWSMEQLLKIKGIGKVKSIQILVWQNLQNVWRKQKPHWDWIFPLRTVLHVIIWKIFGIRNGK